MDTNQTQPTLDDASRAKLDGIVQQMVSNKEPDANIQAVVDDFKQKYAKEPDISKSQPASPLPWQNLPKSTPSEVLNMLPGSQLFKDVSRSVSATYQGIKGGIQKLTGNAAGAQKSFDKYQSTVDAINPTKDFGSGANLALTAAAPLTGGAGSALGTIGRSAALGAGMGVAQGTAQGKPFADVATQGVVGGVLGGALGGIGEAASLVKNGDIEGASSIMNRVARLTPNQANDFQKLAGMSHGEYLAKSGNFGTPEKIIENESKKFVNSLDQVDNAIAKLPGTYKSDPVSSALSELHARESVVSTPGAPSPDFNRINELVKANNKDGLTMAQINDVKRIYERNIKLQYAKDFTGQTSEKLARATNIDTAMRNWQFNQVEQLGLKNLPELNKQTQISKFIINKLGKQITGKTGNDAIGLTDWIMLSHGNPQAIAGFLTKKTFSSKAVQSGIAERLAGSPTIKAIESDLVPTAENAFRKVSPTGAKLLPAPAEGAPKSQNFVPIRNTGESVIEKPAQRITQYNRAQGLLPAPGQTTARIPLNKSGTIQNTFEKNLGLDEVKNAAKNRTTQKTMSQALSEKKAMGLMTSKPAKLLK